MKKHYLSEKRKSSIFVFCMLLIPVVHFIIFWFGVNFNSLRLAFTSIDLATGSTSFSLDHFKTLGNLFKTGEIRLALVNEPFLPLSRLFCSAVLVVAKCPHITPQKNGVKLGGYPYC